MTSYESQLQKALYKAVLEEHQCKLEQLGNGVEADQYRYWVGYLKGLRDCMDLIEKISKKINED